MASLSSYFINDLSNLKSRDSSVIKGKKYRFTILTDRLVRLEYSENGNFEDRATSLVTYRNFPTPEYYITQTDFLLEIKTRYFTLIYDKEKPFKSGKLFSGNNLKVVLNNTDKEWYYGHPEARNFGGINYSLDDFKGKLKLDKGLYSTDGFVVLNDSNSYVLDENDNYNLRDGKDIDLYLFMYKKDFGMCLRDYYTLTDYPSLVPRYSLGNWWYKNDDYNSQEVKQLITNFYDNKIPISVFMLGSKWHDNIKNYDFKDNLNYNEINSVLNKYDIKFGLTVNPNLPITTNDNVYREITKYIESKNKSINLLPFDMNKLGVYFNYLIRPLESKGINIFNIDYKNINDKNNLWLLNHFHYTNSSINKRGVILSRNSAIAPHRYPIIFTGNTNVDWETLSILPFYNLSASNIGVSWIAHAIGGYYNGVEDDELFMRYVQFGVFSPIFILSSDTGKYYKREPWKWNTLKFNTIKDYMQLRNSLIPYIYSEGYNYAENGLPLIQPLYYEYPKIYDEVLCRNQYYFGSEMIIAPIIKKKNFVIDRVVQRFFIPNGVWYDFLSGKKYNGNKYYINFYKDNEYPVFCKAGAIIPMSKNYSTDVPKNMEIQIFPGENNNYVLFEDDGISNSYKFGNYLKTEFTYRYEKNKFSLGIKKIDGTSSSVNNNKRNYRFIFHNINMPDNIIVRVNEKDIVYNSYIEKNNFVIEIVDVDMMGNLLISCMGNNLLVEATRLINEDIQSILYDLEIPTKLKNKIDEIIFSDLLIRKKRIAIRKLKKQKLEERFIKIFISLLEYIDQV